MGEMKGVLKATVFERLSPQRFEDLLWFREELRKKGSRIGKRCRVSA